MNTEFDTGRLDVLETLAKDHGRLETRRYAVSTRLEWLEQRNDWAGLKALGMVESRGANTLNQKRMILELMRLRLV